MAGKKPSVPSMEDRMDAKRSAVQDQKSKIEAVSKKGASGYLKSKQRTEQAVTNTDGAEPEEQTEKRKVGRPASNKTTKMGIAMTPELRTALKVYCTKNNTTAADVIEALVTDFLANAE